MVEIRQVPFRVVLDDLQADFLLAEYEIECSLPEMGGICPSLNAYEILERAGMKTFAAYIGPEIAGFATVMVYEIPHYSRKAGNTESIFVAERHRSVVGRQLVDFVKNYARSQGCATFLFSAPVGSQFDRMLAASKARHANNVYVVKL